MRREKRDWTVCQKEKGNEKRFKVCSKVSSWAKLPLSVHNVIEQSCNTSRSELFPRERERERINPLQPDAYQMCDFSRAMKTCQKRLFIDRIKHTKRHRGT
jgi:hypothetical protein